MTKGIENLREQIGAPFTDGIQTEGVNYARPDYTLTRRPSWLNLGARDIECCLGPLPGSSRWPVVRADFGAGENAVEIFLAVAAVRPEMLGKAVKRFEQRICEKAARIVMAAGFPDDKTSAIGRAAGQHEAERPEIPRASLNP